MNKRKERYTHTYKSITVHLMLLIIFLFENCNNFYLTPDSVSPQPIQEAFQREMITFGQQEGTELMQQAQAELANLPIELQAYILSFLDQKDFHRASLVCHAWRDAAFIAGEEKTLDLSKIELDEKDCQVLLTVP